ncbi:MAG TPA: hypothetical protein DFK12_06705 [Gallionellaceae bacterium]|nr:hypothetical protein [Gallionellaceae bacterium]
MRKKALLIGINRYKIPGADLRGCVNDVENMRNILMKYYGFQDKNIVRLTDFSATKKAIQTGIVKLLKDAKSGDVLVLHYSGHGANVPDTNGDEADHRDEILCPTDLDWYDPLTDDWLRDTFNSVAAGVNLTIIMDCCHSGTNTRQLMPPDAPRIARFLPCPLDIIAVESGRKLTGDIRKTLRISTPEKRKEGDIVAVDIPELLITGCRDTQTSSDAYIGKSYNGALTWNLVSAIKAAKGKLSYRDLHTLTTKGLKADKFDQVPQLEGRNVNFDHPFLASLTASTAKAAPVPQQKKQKVAPRIKATRTTARAFVDSIKLPPVARHLTRDIQPPNEIDYDELKNQAMVVGSEVVSFVKGVTAERREDIVNSALLAQLAANKKASNSDIFKWYDAYFDALGQLGWVLQDSAFNAYEEQADGMEAHEAILQVATVLLGAAPTALAVITSTINAMKSMDANSPWLTIFNRESRTAKSSRFQIALAEQDESGQFMVTMMAYSLEAESSITQVLFFKIRKNKVSLKHNSGKVTINESVLSSVRDKIKAKLADRVGDYVDSIDI